MKPEYCKICHSKIEFLFKKTILKKYPVSYFRCLKCGFVQTEKPYWLKESYASAITSLDIGLISRNINFSLAIEEIIYRYFDKKARFLDFAGGYGMFTRLMRDKGFDYYHSDKYCENLFAKHFSLDDLSNKNKKFELITAFELMEHIPNPDDTLKEIFSMTENFVFSTVLIPDHSFENWWYLGTEHGQHISFYTQNSLIKLAQKYKKNYINSGELHAFTNKKVNIFDTTSPINETIFNKFINNKKTRLLSKTETDYKYLRKLII